MTTSTSPIDCDAAVLLLAAADERALVAGERVALDQHLTGCDSCSAVAVEGEPPDDDGDLRALPIIDPGLYVWAEPLGRGGMGRVMAARDRRLGRRVAIKELIARGHERRFEREARITARLEHPAIVHVHEAGRWPSGELFYAMKLVEGAPLTSLIRERATLAERVALVPNVMAVVDAVAYAHSQGVIHRDLKPANIVVGAFGETVVIDWGLAKELAADGEAHDGVYRSAEDDATAAGLGTPHYMPPEQARGDATDRRVDVYALGATLYHVLAGAPPFGDDRAAAVLARLQHSGPPPLEQVQPAVPPELAAIVGKAMARAPAERYADAGELAADLRRFEAGQLVTASTYSTSTLVRRWIARHRALVIAAAALLLIAAISASLVVRKIIEERADARAARDRAQGDRAGWIGELGRTELLAGDSQRAAPYLIEAMQQKSTPRLRLMLGAAMRSFDAQRSSDTAGRDGPSEPRREVRTAQRSYTADGAVVRITELASGATREVHAGAAVHRLALSPDGTLLAVADIDGNLTLWDAGSGATLAQVDAHRGEVLALSFDDDGTLRSTGDDGYLRLWDVAVLRAQTPFTGVAEARHLVATAHDAVALPVSGGIAVVRGDTRVDLPVPHTARAIALTPRGDRLVVLHEGLEVWDVAARRVVARAPSDGQVMALSPDGKTLVTAEGTRGLLRDAGTLVGQAWLPEHRKPVTAIAFSPGGDVLTRSPDGTAYVWPNSRFGPIDERLGVGVDPVIAFDLVIMGTSHGALVHSTVNGRLPFSSSGYSVKHDTPILGVVRSASGRLIASISGEDVRVVELDPLQIVMVGRYGDWVRERFAIAIDGASGRSADFSPDDALLAVGTADGTIEIWDTELGTRLLRLPRRASAIETLRFTGDGRRLLIVEREGPPQVWTVPHEPDLLEGDELRARFGRHASWLIDRGRLRAF